MTTCLALVRRRARTPPAPSPATTARPLPPPAPQATEYAEQRAQLIKLSTGCKELDGILQGPTSEPAPCPPADSHLSPHTPLTPARAIPPAPAPFLLSTPPRLRPSRWAVRRRWVAGGIETGSITEIYGEFRTGKCSRARATNPDRTAPHRTAPHRTAPHRSTARHTHCTD